MSIPLTDPVLTGYFQEVAESPQISYDSSGITLRHTYHTAASNTQPYVIGPDYLVYMGWVIGSLHWWRNAPESVFTKVRFTGWSIDRSAEEPERQTVTATFAFPYSPAMNRYGEIWEYQQATEMADVYNVLKPANQRTYNSANDPDGGTGLEMAIGVDGDQVHGVQAYRPVAAVRVTKIWNVLPTQAYLDALDKLKGKVNSASWPNGSPLRQWASGEVLFTGSTLRKNNDGNIQVDYDFLTAPQMDDEDIVLADGVTVTVSREPWDYVWYSYVTAPGDYRLQRGIQEAHVAKIYETGDFDALDLIGTV